MPGNVDMTKAAVSRGEIIRKNGMLQKVKKGTGAKSDDVLMHTTPDFAVLGNSIDPEWGMQYKKIGEELEKKYNKNYISGDAISEKTEELNTANLNEAVEELLQRQDQVNQMEGKTQQYQDTGQTNFAQSNGGYVPRYEWGTHGALPGIAGMSAGFGLGIPLATYAAHRIASKKGPGMPVEGPWGVAAGLGLMAGGGVGAYDLYKHLDRQEKGYDTIPEDINELTGRNRAMTPEFYRLTGKTPPVQGEAQGGPVPRYGYGGNSAALAAGLAASGAGTMLASNQFGIKNKILDGLLRGGGIGLGALGSYLTLKGARGIGDEWESRKAAAAKLEEEVSQYMNLGWSRERSLKEVERLRKVREEREKNSLTIGEEGVPIVRMGDLEPRVIHEEAYPNKLDAGTFNPHSKPAFPPSEYPMSSEAYGGYVPRYADGTPQQAQASPQDAIMDADQQGIDPEIAKRIRMAKIAQQNSAGLEGVAAMLGMFNKDTNVANYAQHHIAPAVNPYAGTVERMMGQGMPTMNPYQAEANMNVARMMQAAGMTSGAGARNMAMANSMMAHNAMMNSAQRQVDEMRMQQSNNMAQSMQNMGAQDAANMMAAEQFNAQQDEHLDELRRKAETNAERNKAENLKVMLGGMADVGQLGITPEDIQTKSATLGKTLKDFIAKHRSAPKEEEKKGPLANHHYRSTDLDKQLKQIEQRDVQDVNDYMLTGQTEDHELTKDEKLWNDIWNYEDTPVDEEQLKQKDKTNNKGPDATKSKRKLTPEQKRRLLYTHVRNRRQGGAR